MTLIKDFKNIVAANIQRDGIDNLMEWVENETDFFTAPASTRYHGSYEGGLLEHSLNVYNRLVFEMNTVIGEGWEDIYSPETIAIVALFHDLCKIDRYVLTEKWRKDEDGQWEAYEAYDYNKEKAEMGHGAQSVYYLQKFIQLTEIEAQAIYWHMGAYDISPYSNLANCSETFKWNPLAFLVHRADMAATYITENEAFDFAKSVEAEDVVDEEQDEPVEEKPVRKSRRTKQADTEEAEEEEKPKRTRAARRSRKVEEAETEAADAVEEVEEEKPTRRRSRRTKKEDVAEDTPEEKPARITRRRKKQEDVADEESEVAEEEPKSKIRMPRKGRKAAAKEEPKTYYFYSEEEDVYYKSTENEPNNDNDILVDEQEYLDAMCPVLEEDFFYKLDGQAHVLRAGERLPEEYDEDTWEPITEKEYDKLTTDSEKTVVRASRKKPTPSRRPRK
jgi:hypothetical protein|nr:MAG TPA: Putative helicase [Caudoviricetes sp.]